MSNAAGQVYGNYGMRVGKVAPPLAQPVLLDYTDIQKEGSFIQQQTCGWWNALSPAGKRSHVSHYVPYAGAFGAATREAQIQQQIAIFDAECRGAAPNTSLNYNWTRGFQYPGLPIQMIAPGGDAASDLLDAQHALAAQVALTAAADKRAKMYMATTALAAVAGIAAYAMKPSKKR